MRIAVEHLVDEPIDVVWVDLADLGSHAEWMTEAGSIEIVSDRVTGVGTVLRVPTHVGPLSTEDWIVVTSWEDGTEICVVHIGLVTGTGRFVLESEGTATRIIWDEEFTLPLVFGGPIGEIVAAPILKALWRGNLRRFGRRPR